MDEYLVSDRMLGWISGFQSNILMDILYSVEYSIKFQYPAG